MSQTIRIFLCDSVVEIEEQIIRTLRRIVHIGEAGTTLCTITFQAELPKGHDEKFVVVATRMHLAYWD